MDDNDPECPSPRTAERRRRRAAALAKFQSDAAAAAKLNCHRHRYSTNVSYIPATNPANTLFSHQVQMLINAAEARAKQIERRSAAAAAAAAAAAVTTDVAMTADVDVAVAEPNDILPKDVPSILLALQTLRIRLIIDPALSVQELTAFCAETSRNEALAATNPANSAEFARLKQLRVDLEAEVDRCTPKPKLMFRANSETAAKPTPHVRIASGDHCGHSAFLGNILTSANMRRTFVSITALIAAVNADIGQFLTSPTRSQDRIAVLHSSSSSRSI